jgi:hypothetical protein
MGAERTNKESSTGERALLAALSLLAVSAVPAFG